MRIPSIALNYREVLDPLHPSLAVSIKFFFDKTAVIWLNKNIRSYLSLIHISEPTRRSYIS
ncbi:hypothetical protein, partial [uncultured Enterococcus sp.]|uniref:hypothetical protein n=1 Tax=uncultured Enterococcus sp. TaxID=167972 RepID=UPI002584FD6E